MKKVAIIGAGIVGATAAYYLSQESDLEVTVFDYGQGQATKAAAGIISPWFSKRRNKAWYKMARLGADFYVDLLADLEKSGQDIDFYQRSGVFLLKKDETKLEELYQLALQRREESPLIGRLGIIDQASANELFSGLQGFDRLLYASGGARVDGQLLVTRLLEASRVKLVKEKVTLTPLASGYQIDKEVFDQVILATGAWLGHLLEPLGYSVDVRPQKGQLRDYQLFLLENTDGAYLFYDQENETKLRFFYELMKKINDDKQMKEALKLLADSKRYADLLKPQPKAAQPKAKK